MQCFLVCKQNFNSKQNQTMYQLIDIITYLSSYILRRPPTFCEISTFFDWYYYQSRKGGDFVKKFVAFSEYMNFNVYTNQLICFDFNCVHATVASIINFRSFLFCQGFSTKLDHCTVCCQKDIFLFKWQL